MKEPGDTNAPIPGARITADKSKHLFASAGIIIFLTILTRPLGVFREILNAAYFGAGRSLDTFLVASSVPLFFCTMLGGGLVQSVVRGLSEAVEINPERG